jgi:hypothetical protein
MEPEFLAIINSWRATLDDTEIALLRGMREEREREAWRVRGTSA